MGVFFEINDYFRTGGNVSVNDLSQLINTLSNQDFAFLGWINLISWRTYSARRGLPGS